MIIFNEWALDRCKMESELTDYMLSNVKVFNNFSKIEDRDTQITHGDVTNGRIYVDFKFDCYNNNNFVFELSQKSGTNWVDELDVSTIIAYVKLSQQRAYFTTVRALRDFRNTDIFRSRKTMTAKYSATTFKNFRITEIPFMKSLNITLTDYFNKYIKQSCSDEILYR